MNLTIQIVIFLFTAFVILKGADLFVNSAVAIAEGMGISKAIVGATIVSLATTLPELCVSSFAVLSGHAQVALGNAVGSVVCNIGLFGFCVLISTIVIKKKILLQQGLIMLAAGLLLYLFSRWGIISRPAGILLLACFIFYAWFSYKKAKERHQRKKEFALAKKILLFISGAILVVGGSRVIVLLGIKIATSLGIPELIISASLIALGTSLPELITSLTALFKGQVEISAANIIGANILDIFLVVGVSATISPLPIEPQTKSLILPMMLLLMSLMLFFGWTKKKYQRWEGMVLFSVYGVFLFLLFV